MEEADKIKMLEDRIFILERAISQTIPFLYDLERKANLYTIADYLRDAHWIADDLEFVLSRNQKEDR